MKRILLIPSLALLGALCLQNTSTAHGGTYRGPGDTVPPGGGGGGGGGAGPSTPSPSGPSTGGPSGPSTPSPAGPAGVPTGGPGGRPSGPVTGGPGSSGPDLTLWEFWWGFNKDPYLNLKAAIYNDVSTDFEEAYLGNGTKSQKKNSLRPSESAIREKIVPALREALEKERANDIVTGSMVALAKIGDIKNEEGVSELEQMIAKFLADSQQEIAETAAVALGILANDGSVKTLENLVRDNEDGRKAVKANEVPYRTRAFAAYGLGLIGARTNNNQVRQDIASILIEMLKKPDTSTRDVKVACLIALGLTPIAIETGEGGENNATASRQSEIKWLLSYLKDENNHYLIRAHAPTAMARLLNGDSIKPKDAKQIPPELREEVAKALLDTLAEHSKEKDEVQQSSILALGMIADTDKDKLDSDIRDRLMKVADKSNDIQSKNFACIALAQIGGRQGAGEDNDKGVKDLRNFLGEKMKGSTHIRPWAGLGVGVMERAIADNPTGGQTPSGSQKEALRAALKDAKSPDEQGAYSIACCIARDMESKAALFDKLKQAAGDQTRGYVAVSLGLIGDREAIKPIQDIVRESKYKPDLLKQAAIGLGLLGDKELVQDMCTMLGEAKGLSAQAAIASALGFIGDSRSIDPLITMLKKKEGITDSARGFAAVALGIVADKEPLPWNSKISVNLNYRANTTTLTGENGTGILDIL
ncbi:MAG: HEAT repeat domain-containing protein [Planctomycetes bacterium]|nr:HEAT repeat domain-containing protein [Planctomycetota bacterium]